MDTDENAFEAPELSYQELEIQLKHYEKLLDKCHKELQEERNKNFVPNDGYEVVEGGRKNKKRKTNKTHSKTRGRKH